MQLTYHLSNLLSSCAIPYKPPYCIAGNVFHFTGNLLCYDRFYQAQSSLNFCLDNMEIL